MSNPPPNSSIRLQLYHPRSGLNFDFEKEPKWELYLNERRTTTRELQKKNDADYESPCNQLAKGQFKLVFFSRRRYPPPRAPLQRPTPRNVEGN